MAVLVDPAIWTWREEKWSHLVSDVSYAEVHAFAERLAIPRRAFQGDHYDLPARMRALAVELGAQQVTSRELLLRLKGAGLRTGRQRV